MLIVVGNTAIDKTSEALLQDDGLSNQTRGSYEMLSIKSKEYLNVISRLRTQAWLLARYFSLLDALVNSDTPDRTQQAIGGAVDGLNSLVTSKPNSGQVMCGIFSRTGPNQKAIAKTDVKTHQGFFCS